jgi:dienelactone hydrolase
MGEEPHSKTIWPRHEHSGPAGWGNFAQSEQPVKEQWMHHAIAAVILGHSLLRSLPEVNPGLIGITGISRGGVLTCAAAGIDNRFAFAVPVYGCGFLDDEYCGLYDKLTDDEKLISVTSKLKTIPHQHRLKVHARSSAQSSTSPAPPACGRTEPEIRLTHLWIQSNPSYRHQFHTPQRLATLIFLTRMPLYIVRLILYN